MPPYPSLLEVALDLSRTSDKLHAMRTVGVPYTDAQIANAVSDAREQAREIARDLSENGAPVRADREVIALIAFLQRLGRQPVTANVPMQTASLAATAH